MWDSLCFLLKVQINGILGSGQDLIVLWLMLKTIHLNVYIPFLCFLLCQQVCNALKNVMNLYSWLVSLTCCCNELICKITFSLIRVLMFVKWMSFTQHFSGFTPSDAEKRQLFWSNLGKSCDLLVLRVFVEDDSGLPPRQTWAQYL